MSRPWREPRITPDDPTGAGKFTEFAGVVNTRSRKDIGFKALYVGDNVVLSDTKKVVRRDGYSLYRAGTIQSGFGLGDRLYVVDDGTLLHLASATDARTLTTGLTGTDYNWGEINGDGYFVNGVDAGIVRGDQFLPWRLDTPAIASVEVVATSSVPSTVFNVGASYTEALWRFVATYETSDGRETAPSEVFEVRASPLASLFRITVAPGYARTNVYVTEPDGTVFRLAVQTTAAVVTLSPVITGRELLTFGCSSLPSGVHRIEFFQGRCFAAEHIPQLDLSVVWISRPLAFHLFNQADDFLLVPGKVGVLTWCNQGLLIGTTQKIYQYTDDRELNLLVSYGVVPGTGVDTDAESVAYFWTVRGICRAMPFENLTEMDIGMAPGQRVATRLLYRNGMQQFVAVTQGGGTPHNYHTERT